MSVFVDGKYTFSLSLDELLQQKLKNDQELSDQAVKKLKKISADGKLRQRALEWLLNRPHSEREFRDYLYRKKAESEQIESLVSEFSQKGYLDNTKFTQWYGELLTRRGKSNRAIKSELFKKGISREVVDQVLTELGEDETKRLKEVIAKKQRLARYKNDPVKLARYLTSQGFSYGLVREILGERLGT